MPDRDGRPTEDKARSEEAPSLDLFVGERPTRELLHWQWLWEGDYPFPVRSHRGFLGRMVVLTKRLLRPVVRFATKDLWDRQRAFNLILLENVGKDQQLASQVRDLHAHVEQIHKDFSGAIEAHAERMVEFDARQSVGMQDVMRHNDALFARADQKLDRYRREARQLWGQLGAFIAAQEAEPPRPLAEVQSEQSYLELELRHRGSEEEIAERVAAYLPYLGGEGEVLDLGCGRGEALQVLARKGLAVRGVDSSGEMIARCNEKGLEAVRADLFEHLASVKEGSLRGVVSFHVIEHLPGESLERLVRLAWRALRPGGVLILETPSPLSLINSARNFWTDPTHTRPVHPASLEESYRAAGFEPVHRVDLHPFPENERLPEIDLARVPEEQQALAHDVNRLRDLLDDLLFGCRDYGLLGFKP